jgi:hypothetical protein
MLKNIMTRTITGSALAVGVALACMFAFAMPAFATTWDTTGAYTVNVNYLGVDYPETLVLTQSGTAITGVSLDTIPPASLFTITGGSVVGDAISITANLGSLVVNLTGTIAPGGSMSGTWADEAPGTRVGTWTSTSGAATDVTPASVSGSKFFDINGNGAWNAGEPGLSGWTFNLAGPTPGSQVTSAGGAYSFGSLVAGAYTLTETLKAGWTQTTPNPSFTLAVGENKTGVNIGNACFVSTNGKSKGYWTSKNGEMTMNDGPNGFTLELGLLTNLNLRSENGGVFDPGTYPAFKTWVGKESNAKNMAYMLSAQLAAVELSVEAGFTDRDSQVVAMNPLLAGISGMSALGIISVDDLMAAANSALETDGSTPAGDTNRAYQEALKNALEKVANGQSVQVCTMTFSATNSEYDNTPVDSSDQYGDGPISFTWNPVTGNVLGGLWEEIVPPTSGTHYLNDIVSGTVDGGGNVTLNFHRVADNYSFSFTGTLVGGVLTGQAAGPYFFTATGTVTP